MLQLFGIHWVMLESIKNFLFFWRNWLGKHGLDTWKLILGCLMWIVWKDKNRHSFDNFESSLDQLKSGFHCTLLIALGVRVSLIVLPLLIFLFPLDLPFDFSVFFFFFFFVPLYSLS